MPLMATILERLMGVFLAILATLEARRVKAIQATMATVMRRKTLVANVASKSWKVAKKYSFSLKMLNYKRYAFFLNNRAEVLALDWTKD